MKSAYQMQMTSFRPDFYSVDVMEREIFFHLMRNSEEFSKMDDADRNVMAWMVIESPGKFRSWLEYIVMDYKRKKSVNINAKRLKDEIQQAIFSE